jgi:hypothetical protein
MRRLRCVCFLPLLTVLVWGQGAPQSKPSPLPNQPDALVNSLYEQVVARHPLGVPYGADMKVFAPYLSKALLHRFDQTNACFADWHRQNPDPNMKPPVGLIESGVFSGGNEEAEPQAFHIEKTESENDGSSRVYVKLTLGAAPPEKPLIWYVAAVVVRENGRPVVEDVLFLKDNDREIDARLSEALATGCNGTRWVGEGGHQH